MDRRVVCVRGVCSCDDGLFVATSGDAVPEGVARASRRHARSGNTLEHLFNLSGASSEGVTPKVVSRVLDEFDESNQKAPRMRAVKNQSLDKNPCYLFFYGHILALSEEVECDTGEVTSVTGWEAQLVDDSVDTDVAAVVIQLHELQKNFNLRSRLKCDLRALKSRECMDSTIQNK